MKLLAIRGENLASLAAPFVLDFCAAPLAEASLFAITGPTGAGKSTLLDTVTLALYAQTPRSSAAGSGKLTLESGEAMTLQDPRQLVRRGAPNAYAEVDFCSEDGRRWRARWQVKRSTRGDSGALRAAEHSLTDLDQNALVSNRKSEVGPAIVERIGLNYAQFTRTVLLAQNEFAAFLRALEGQRAELLEALTGTEQYRQLSILAFETARDSADAVAALQAALAGQLPLSPSERAALDARLEAATHTHTQASALQRQLDRWQARQDAIAQQTARAAQLQETLATLATQAPAAEATQALAADYQRWLPLQQRDSALQASAVALAESAALLQRRIDEHVAVVAHIAHCAQAHASAKQALADATQTQDQAEPALQQLRHDHRRAHAIEASQRELNDRHVALQARTAQLAAQRQQLDQTAAALRRSSVAPAPPDGTTVAASDARRAATELQTLRDLERATDAQAQTLATLQPALEEAASALDDAAETVRAAQAAVDADSAPHSALAQCIDQERAARGALDRHQADWRALEACVLAATQLQAAQAVCAVTADQLAPLERSLSTLAAQVQAQQADLRERQQALDAGRALLQRIERATGDTARALRSALVAEQPCPVCGSTEHPDAATPLPADPTLSALRDDLQAQERDLADADVVTQTSARELAVAQAHGAQTVEQLSSQRAALDVLRTSHAATRAALGVSDGADLAAAQKSARDALAQAQSQLDAAQAALQQAQTQVEQHATLTQALQRAKQRHEAAGTAHISRHDEAQKLVRQLEALQQRRSDSAERARTMRVDIVHWDALASRAKADWVAALSDWADALAAFDDAAATRAEPIAQRERDEREWNTAQAGNAEALLAVQRERDALQAEQAGLRLSPDPEAWATTLRSVVHQAQADLGAATTAVSEAERDAASLRSTIEHLQQQLSERSTALESAYAALAADWSAAAFSAERLSALAEIDAEQLARAVQAAQAHAAQLREAQIAHAQAIENLAAFRSEPNAAVEPNESPAEIDEALSTAKHDLAVAQAEQHDDNRRLQAAESYAAELAALQAKAHVDAQLRELIGSANGDKFCRYAQQHTLDGLLAYANQQLQQLAPRYRLARIRDSLDLMVSDLELDGSLRGIPSLSGGESFLVSLALALGLAAVSAERVNVETLLIDEGFGSLDDASLDLAMQALERLHGSGKRVGVISHLGELTERIATRIAVIPDEPGSSRVSVEAGL